MKGCNVNFCFDFGLFYYKFFIKIYTTPFLSVRLISERIGYF